MADYFVQMVVHQTIPRSDMTPLEALLLSHIFTGEENGEGVYFFSEQGPADMLWLNRKALSTALAASEAAQSSVHSFIRDQFAELDPGADEVELDMSGHDWSGLFQDIVRRSKTLEQITIEAAFTCSRMRSDGFGGMAMLITADAVLSKSTQELLQEFEQTLKAAPAGAMGSAADAAASARSKASNTTG